MEQTHRWDKVYFQGLGWGWVGGAPRAPPTPGRVNNTTRCPSPETSPTHIIKNNEKAAPRARLPHRRHLFTELSCVKKNLWCSALNSYAARYTKIEGEKCTINCTNRRNQGLISVDRRASLLSHLQYPVLI